jgi:transposase
MMDSDSQSVSSAEKRQYQRHEQVTSRAKIDAVIRLIKGESVEVLSQELGVSVRRIERWQSRFLEAGSAELAKRTDTPSTSWLAKNSPSIRQWFWLLLALVAVICLLAVFMQRGSPE